MQTRQFTDNQFLNRHRMDVQSQFGEDGIIGKIFEIIPKAEQNNWSCEFGAWDGKHCSNTFNLVVNKGWSGVFIEADTRKFADLQKTYRDFKKAVLHNKYVNRTGADTLDSILKESGAPIDLDLLSIDVDGMDYYLWESVKEYRPKLVVIEFNPTIPDNIRYIQVDDYTQKHGTSLLGMTDLAKSKGYELICVNSENALYIDRKFFPLFNIADNSIPALKYYREPLQVFQLFDGTLVFHANSPERLYWHSLPVEFNKLQILPSFVRKLHTPWSRGLLARLARIPIRLLREYRDKKLGTIDPGEWKM